MSPNEVRVQPTQRIVEMLVGLKPCDEAVAWLASVISDPVAVAGVGELSRRYIAKSISGCTTLRAKAAGSVLIDGVKFKELLWRHRMPLTEVGLAIGKSNGLVSVLCHKGRASYWTLDAIATEVLDMRVEDLIAEIGTDEELERLAV